MKIFLNLGVPTKLFQGKRLPSKIPHLTSDINKRAWDGNWQTLWVESWALCPRSTEITEDRVNSGTSCMSLKDLIRTALVIHSSVFTQLVSPVTLSVFLPSSPSHPQISESLHIPSLTTWLDDHIHHGCLTVLITYQMFWFSRSFTCCPSTRKHSWGDLIWYNDWRYFPSAEHFLHSVFSP